MPRIEITQLQLKPPTQGPFKLIKFCYFLVVLFLYNCAENKSSTPKQETEETRTELSTSDMQSSKTILCFGDSITAGYGLEDTNDAYPALIQHKIDSLGLNYEVVNSGLSGETSSGGLSRIQWVLNQDIDIFLLELGANDGLRGVPLSETRSNLQSIIDIVKDKNAEIQIILAGMELPPNMGRDYTTEFRKVYGELAASNEVIFIPFILKDVGGVAELNQDDGIHPTVEGHKIVANTVWEVLQPLL
jgi:acyl-CoA thioesterase-1